ncbi:MAG: HAMP domain-containing protein, partial [Anaerolineae bacterium]
MGGIGRFCHAIALTALVSGPGGRGLAAQVDTALTETAVQLLPMLVQGLVGGGIAALILTGLPHLRPAPKLTPPPYAYSLRQQLLGRVALFGFLLMAVLVTAVFLLTTWAATTSVSNQMARNAEVVAAEVPQFQNHLHNLLAQVDETTLLSQDAEASKASLGQMFRADPFYRRILLVNPDQSIRAIFPEDAADISLTTSEKEAVAAALTTSSDTASAADTGEADAVAAALTTSSDTASAADTGEADAVVSFVAPVADETGEPTAVLVGRVAELSLRNLIVGLQGTAGEGVGFIVDEDNRIIAHTDSSQLLTEWDVTNIEPGTVTHFRDPETGQHDLVYTQTTADTPWTIVTAVPYAVVLNQVGLIGGPLALLVMVVTAVLYANLAYFGQETTRPITELVEAARTIAADGRWQPSPQAERHDEVGQLHRAFNQMHQSRQKKLHELSLLLDVSNDVSHHLEINQGMPAILRGALRGTGASGARAVVLNPTGSYPLVFGEGPAANTMAVLDRAIMTRLRTGDDLALDSPAAIKETLLPGMEPPVLAVVAIPLRSQERFMGVIWLGYRQAHSFDPAAADLLKALAGQATVLVENARLFSLAEGGRRRLAAVLASTTNAVIVTDQTDRIMLVNPAMAEIFGLSP